MIFPGGIFMERRQTTIHFTDNDIQATVILAQAKQKGQGHSQQMAENYPVYAGMANDQHPIAFHITGNQFKRR